MICFPHGGGGVHAYRAWDELLPPWIEVQTVSLPGRGPRYSEKALTDLPTLVGCVAEAVQFSVDRPFALFGHSVGALVAFETARRLEAGGLPPLRVFVSGYPPPDGNKPPSDLHQASDDDLSAYLNELGGEAANLGDSADPELRAMILASVRADFALVEHRAAASAVKLAASMSVLGGASDNAAPPEELMGWNALSSGRCNQRTFAGGHFYTQTACRELLDSIAETLRADLDDLPKSLMFGPRAAAPLDLPLHQLFRAQAQETPNAVALIGQDRHLTFAELDADSDRLACRLLAQGGGLDRLVAILMETCIDYVIAYLAALKTGGGYLPIPTATPPDAIADMLEAAGPVAVVTSPGQVDRLPPDWQSSDRCTVLSHDWQKQLDSLATSALAAAGRPGPDNVAYCVMTSGTTGRPKGILCPHRGAVNSYWWRYRHLPYGNGEIEACNVFFVWEVLRPLLQGRPACVVPDDVIFDPRRLVAFLADNSITRVLLTPSLLEQVLTASGGDLQRRLPCLKTVLLNGEVVSSALVETFRATLPRVNLVNDYSISECHDVSHIDLSEVSGFSGRHAPVGRPMDNVNVYVLDGNLLPVPVGERGEVYVGGDNIAVGYLAAPEETEKRFLPDPFAADAGPGRQPGRMFRTGDVGRILPDGNLQILGRAHFMVKLRGYSVVPSAIEAEIRSDPACGAALVVSVNDEATGQPDRLIAYVAGAAGAPTPREIDSLRSRLKERLPAYAIPARIVPIPSLPIDPATGKVDRRALPSLDDDRPSQEPAARLTFMENDAKIVEDLAAIWEQILGVSGIGPSDNFFDRGGHSLSAGEMTRAAERRFDVVLSVIDVFDHPTFADYARHIAVKASRPTATLSTSGPFLRPSERLSDDIAVIGMAGRFPGAPTIADLWSLALERRSGLTRLQDADHAQRGVPRRLLDDPRFIGVAAILADVDRFDPRFWGLSEAEAIVMDPQQRLFLECCWHALEASGHSPADAGGEIGVYAGCYLPGYLIHHLGAKQHYDPADPAGFHLAELGNDKDYLASRTAYLMNLNGPAVGVQTSCSTGLVAIAQAAMALRDGQCRMALAGASSISFPQGGYIAADGHIGSPSGICRPFDAEADGTILGDGVGVVVLRPLQDALDDGDDVLAVIKGYAVNNDGGAKAGYSAPSAAGQAAVIERAIANSRVAADSIGYVEAHGTGTKLGDPIELRGLNEAFQRCGGARARCAVGSIKANIGHANIAAGVAGFMKAVMAVRSGTIPPLANYSQENPQLELARSPFYIPREKAPWPAAQGHPRRAGVSSFGIGGTNCHIVIEQAPQQSAAGPPAADPKAASEILPLSATTPEALAELAERLAAHLEKSPGAPLADVADTLQDGRSVFELRLAVSAASASQGALALRTAAANLPAVATAKDRATGTGGGIAFVFPGHGAQYPGMGTGLREALPSFRRHFDDIASYFGRSGTQLSDSLSALPLTGCGDADPLTVQAGLYAVDLALARTLSEWGIRPDAVCGHSLGEYAAAVVAGVLSDTDAAHLITARAMATAAAVPGRMLWLAAGERQVGDYVTGRRDLAIAAVNSPRDTVLSGTAEEIAAAQEWALRMGIDTRTLSVNRAFHSPLIEEATRALEEAASDISMSPPVVPLLSNLTGRWWSGDEVGHPGYWACHMRSPVRFADNCSAIESLAPKAVVEVGPGRTLSGPLRRCRSARPEAGAIVPLLALASGNPEGEEKALSQALSELWQAGIDIDWNAKRCSRPVRRTALPGYPFARHRCWPLNDAAARDLAAGDSSDRENRAATPRSPAHPTEDADPADKRNRRVPFGDIFWLPSWSRSPPPGACVQSDAAEPPPNVALISPAGGVAGHLADVLASSLQRKGWRPILVRSGKDAPGSLAAALPKSNGSLRIVDLSWLDAPAVDADDTVTATAAICCMLTRLAPLSLTQTLDYWLLTHGALKVSTEPSKSLRAPLAGPILVAPQENPRIAARLIDIQCDAATLSDNGPSARLPELAGLILDEIVSRVPRREPLLALRGSDRWVERFEPLALPVDAVDAGRLRLTRMQGPHVISGGLGRIGQVLARQLVEIGGTVVLLSRRSPPHREELTALFGKAARSIDVMQCDVSDAEALAAVLRDLARSRGALGGIFHCAGLADLRDLDETDEETVRAEMRPKIEGTENLRAAIGSLSSAQLPEPGFVMLFSSLAATLGGLGMAGYSAANRYLDALAAEGPGQGGIPWLSIGFDDWDFEYGKEQVAAYTHTRSGLALSPDEGVRAIYAVLGWSPARHLVLSATPLQERISNWTTMRTGARQDTAAQQSSLCVAAAPDVALKKITGINDAQSLVLKAYAKLIGPRHLELDADFFELGGDSLLAAQLASELRSQVEEGTEIRIGDVFDCPTPRRLAACVADRLRGGSGPVAPLQGVQDNDPF